MRKAILTSLLLLFCSTTPLAAFQCGDVLVRARGIHLWPDDSSGSLSTVPNAKASVGHSTTGEVDFTYMATNNWGVELILATSKHTLSGKDALSGQKVGTTWLLPPTLTLQYHFLPNCRFQPYLGVGVNWTTFYREKSSLDKTKISLDHSWGVAGQVGFDYVVCRDWFLNVDVKYVDIDTKVRLKGAIKDSLHVDIDPWIFGIGIGRRF